MDEVEYLKERVELMQLYLKDTEKCAKKWRRTVAKNLYLLGYTIKQIARIMEVSEHLVQTYLDELKEEIFEEESDAE